jgi:hypothetical protein
VGFVRYWRLLRGFYNARYDYEYQKVEEAYSILLNDKKVIDKHHPAIFEAQQKYLQKYALQG